MRFQAICSAKCFFVMNKYLIAIYLSFKIKNAPSCVKVVETKTARISNLSNLEEGNESFN